MAFKAVSKNSLVAVLISSSPPVLMALVSQEPKFDPPLRLLGVF